MDKKRRFEAILAKCPSIIRRPVVPKIGVYFLHFECGIGWYSIIEEALEKIEHIVANMPLKDSHDIYVNIVKEEGGELFIHMNSSTAEIDLIIDEAKAKCRITCSKCGEPGTKPAHNMCAICKPCSDDIVTKIGLS
jgi:hypothetical protein